MTEIELFGLIVLPIVVAVGGYVFAIWQDHNLSRQDPHPSSESYRNRVVIEGRLIAAFAEFERMFLKPSNDSFTEKKLISGSTHRTS